MSQSQRPTPAAATPHPLLLRLVHWITAAAVPLAFAVIWSREAIDGDVARQWLLSSHRWIGLLVWTATLLRVSVKVGALLGSSAGRVPAQGIASLPQPVRLASAGAHAVMYLGLLALPLLGWALTNAQGHPLGLGAFHLPMLAQPDPDLADTLEDFHVYTGYALGSLIVLHLAAVAWHHRWRRDDVLSLMWPRLNRS